MTRPPDDATATAQLEQACANWRALALAQREAIESKNWARVRSCHDAIEMLQVTLNCWLPLLRHARPAPGTTPTPFEIGLRQTFTELVQLEQANQALLSDTRKTAELNLTHHDRAARTLHQLRQSYAPSGLQSDWNKWS